MMMLHWCRHAEARHADAWQVNERSGTTPDPDAEPISSVPLRTRSAPSLQRDTFVDAVAPIFPIESDTHSSDGRMYLTGTVRQRGDSYVIEQQLDLDTGVGPRWTTPRIHRVMATEATRVALQEHLGQIVTISGTPSHSDERHRTAISLESIQPLGPASESTD
jgi:hypothetical protein